MSLTENSCVKFLCIYLFLYFVFDHIAIIRRLCFRGCDIRQVRENWVTLKLNGKRIEFAADYVNLLGENHKETITETK
jgi:hypothetical protein